MVNKIETIYVQPVKIKPLEVKPLLTIAQAAEYLQEHPHTVRRWIWAGKLKAKKFGTQRGFGWRIDFDDVRAMLKPVAPKPEYINWSSRGGVTRKSAELSMALLVELGLVED